MRPFCITLPTPFAVGPVNAYLFREDPVTLVDPGPLYPPAQEVLREALSAQGIDEGRVAQILLTHHHPDHVGYAPVLASRSGAVIRMHPEAAVRARRPVGDLAATEAMFRMHGVPGAVIAAMRRELQRLVGYVAPMGECLPIAEGEHLFLDGEELEAMVLPGHAPGHVALRGRDALLGGDVLIDGITPNPILEVGPEGRRPSLKEYRASLARLKTLPPLRVYSGHRGEIADHLALIARYEVDIARRQEEVLAALGERPRSAFAISQELFPMEGGADPFLALSETFAHLDLLRTEGAVEEVEEAGGRCFRRLAAR